jgi:hypothetical protein
VKQDKMKNVELSCIQLIETSADVRLRVATIQRFMVETTQGYLSHAELDHLRTVIRLTVEFHYYLQAACTHVSCATYVSESIFSGIESYCALTRAYKALGGATDSKIEWTAVSSPLMSGQFTSTFDAFDRESSFENKCRLLLDLFKIQIVWAAISYE